MSSRSTGRASGLSSLRLQEMSRTERVKAAVRGEPVDRVPVCFWHHFQPAGSGRNLAEASLRFFDDLYDLDILKLMPDVPYPFPKKSISHPDHWRLIEPIDNARSRFFQQRAEAVSVHRDELGYDTPIVVTLFSPLCEAMYFARDHELFLQHAREHPMIVHEALATIAENLRAHIADVIAAGADGVFFALQGCTTSVMPVDLYKEFGRPYDVMALRAPSTGGLTFSISMEARI